MPLERSQVKKLNKTEYKYTVLYRGRLKIASSSERFQAPTFTLSCAHLSPHPTRHLDWFGRFGTAHGYVRQTRREKHTEHRQSVTPSAAGDAA